MKKINELRLVNFLASLNTEDLPLIIHISTSAQKKLFELKNWIDENIPKNLCFNTDPIDQLIEYADNNDEIAHIFVMALNPGQSDYFYTEYDIFASGKVISTYESHSGKHEDLFEKFKGKREPFEIELQKIPEMMKNDMEMAKTMMKKVQKTLGKNYEVDTIDEIEDVILK